MHVAVVGNGKMGSAIFRVLANSSVEAATLYTRNASTAREQERKLRKALERALRGTVTDDEIRTRAENFRITDRLEDLAPADLVIETVSEEYRLKADLFARIESIVDENAILATNTSSISVEKLAGELDHPERFCGLHFFHPVPMIRLVEVIKWKGTSTEAIDRAVAFCQGIQRSPIVVGDGPGSAINVILAHFYVEGLYILEEGLALPSQVDELARRYFYLGPCEAMDVVGIDFFVNALDIFLSGDGWCGAERNAGAEIPEKVGRGFHPPRLLSALLASDRTGKKVSEGIYRYEKDLPVDEAPEFYANSPRELGIAPPPPDLLARRLLYSVFNGSLDVLSTSASSPSALDFGIKEVLLMREGPFRMMESLGEAEVRQSFDSLAAEVGERFGREEFPIFERGR